MKKFFDRLLADPVWASARLCTMLAVALLIAFAIMAILHPAQAADATVSWTNPTTNIDGSAIPATGSTALTGTRIEYGSCSGTAFGTKAGEITVAAPATSAVVTGLAPGSTYCFQAFARNGLGAESAASNVASKAIPVPVPKPPVLSSTITLAYDLRNSRPYRVVGSLPLGTPCGAFVAKVSGSSYYEIPRSAVTLTKPPRSARLVTKCAVG